MSIYTLHPLDPRPGHRLHQGPVQPRARMGVRII